MAQLPQFLTMWKNHAAVWEDLGTCQTAHAASMIGNLDIRRGVIALRVVSLGFVLGHVSAAHLRYLQASCGQL